ncbi:MAG: ATP-binding protein, partial [Candidatus Methanofastidiosia archaeon]
MKESENESLFIYGVAGIGKTSLIEKCRDMIDEKNLIMYVRTTENALRVVKEMFNQLNIEIKKTHSFLDRITYSRETKILNKIIDMANRFLEKPILPLPEKSIFYDDIMELFGDLMNKLKDKKLFVFLDDFQNVDGERKELIMHLIKNRKKNMHFILTWRTTEKEIPYEFERIMETINLTEMKKEEFEKIIPKELNPQEKAIEYSVKIFKGNPYYLTAFLIYLKRKKINEFTIELMKKILPEGIEEIDKFLHCNIFEKQKSFKDVLKASSILRKRFDYNTISIILEKKEDEKDEIEKKIKTLEKRELFRRENPKYLYSHNLF